MDSNAIKVQVQKTLMEVGGLSSAGESLKETSDLYEAGLTSRASVSVMLALEDEFDIEFPDQMLNRHTFQSITAISQAIETILENGE